MNLVCRSWSRLHAGRLRATTDFTAAADRDVIIFLVPTPSDERGAFTNAYLLAALEALGPALRVGCRLPGRGGREHGDARVVRVGDRAGA